MDKGTTSRRWKIQDFILDYIVPVLTVLLFLFFLFVVIIDISFAKNNYENLKNYISSSVEKRNQTVRISGELI